MIEVKPAGAVQRMGTYSGVNFYGCLFDSLANKRAVVGSSVYDQSTIDALEARIAELEKAAGREKKLESLLIECRGHLKGWKMSMLARPRERLIEGIDSVIDGGTFNAKIGGENVDG